ncbi:unnamed protein product [[Actinomadura] parvosata subsp. kistnae]|nr:unnamed protein product [Actinomadura parvosata subsp. kistnae]
MRAQKAVASFDSATGMLRALSRFLHDRDVPMLGQGPRALEPVAAAVAGAAARLPRPAKEKLYAAGGWAEAVPPRRVPGIRSEELARWVSGHYPRGPYPVAFIGSSNGALVHLAAALRAPWLPQTLLLPVRRHGVGPTTRAATCGRPARPGRRCWPPTPTWCCTTCTTPTRTG